jgi:hypothetical protein
MAPTGVIIVDIVPCILYVIEGDMLCGHYGPHSPQIQGTVWNYPKFHELMLIVDDMS